MTGDVRQLYAAPARTHHEAVERYLNVLRSTLRFVSATVVVYYTPLDATHYLLTHNDQGGDRVRIPREDRPPLLLDISQLFHWYEDTEQVVPGNRYRVKVDEYIYSLYDRDPSGDPGIKPLISWHWHPLDQDGNEHGKPHPHLHVEGSNDHYCGLRRLHLPTSRVTLEAVVEFILDDLHANAVTTAWRTELREQRRRVHGFLSWTGGGPPPSDE